MLQTGRRLRVLGVVSALVSAAALASPALASSVEVPLALVSAVRFDAYAAQSQNQVYIATAKDLMRAGRAEDALVVLEPAALQLAGWSKGSGRSLDHDQTEVLYLRAFALTELGRRADAVEALEQLVALAPHAPRYIVELAFAYRKAGEKAKALDTYRRATAEAAQGGEDAQRYRAAALRGVGYMLVDQGDLRGAEQAYRDSLLYDPNSQIAANELSFIARKRASGEQKGG